MTTKDRWFQFLRNTGLPVKDSKAVIQKCISEIKDINWDGDSNPATSNISDDYFSRRIIRMAIDYLKEHKPNSSFIRRYDTNT